MDWFLYCLRRYATFHGRASRPEYWYYALVMCGMLLVLMMFDGIIGRFDSESGTGLLSTIFLVANLLPSLAVGARRLHDTGRSGWWQLVNLVPYIGTLILLGLFALRGQPESNRYGLPPTHAPDAPRA